MMEKNEVICLKSIGKGPFFEEYLVCMRSEDAKHKNFALRAMKKSLITYSKSDEELVLLELMVRTRIRHPFLINQVCAFQDYDNLYYVYDYAPARLLDSKILPKKFSIEISKFYIAEMFLCLKYLHTKSQNYTYLCPQNVLLGADGHIKLDYSFCNCLEYNCNTMADNIGYISPDYIEHNRFSYLSDYWSMGIVLYRMIFGCTPFSGLDFESTVAEIRKCVLEIPGTVDKHAVDLIEFLLNKEMFQTWPSCNDFEAAIMSHPFFTGIDWSQIESKALEPPFLIKVPEYDLDVLPTLSTLYTTDFIVDDKDGYGTIFSNYNTVHFLRKK